MYVINSIRPDIALVCRLSKYTHNLSKNHWTKLKRVIKYLRGITNKHFEWSTSMIEGYTYMKKISNLILLMDMCLP